MSTFKNKKQTTQKTVALDDSYNFDLAKSPPNAVELEDKILGAIMIDNLMLNDVVQVLESGHFYKKSNGIIFQAMINLDGKREPIDANTVKQELIRTLKLQEVGGVEYLIDLISSTSTSANALEYAKLVYEKYMLRNLIHISSGIVTSCFDPTVNPHKVLDEAEQKILDISESLSKKRVISVSEEIDGLITKLADQRSDKSGVTGVPTGYTILDDYTAGFQKSELIIIAGRPSHGKTALSMNIAKNAAVKHGKSIGIFSLEMTFRELMLRLLAGEARVDGKKLKTGRSSDKEWNQVMSTYHKLKTKLYIDDSSELSILEIRAKARRMKMDYGIDMIIVDYLQLVRGQDNAERRDLEVAYVSRGLKALAKELDIPVVACAQLNRGIETRTSSKHPQLADLRESGSIEQDADVVIFVHRPSVGAKLDPTDAKYEETLRRADIIIGKQRNGPTGNFELIFMSEYAQFENKIVQPDFEIPASRQNAADPF